MSRYFTKEDFKEEFDLSRVDEVLNRLYKEEDVTSEQEYALEIFVMSDTLDKLDEMEEVLEKMDIYTDSIEKHDDGCELIASTQPMKMDPEVIKKWYTNLWEEGFKFDCKPDGWHVLVD